MSQRTSEVSGLPKLLGRMVEDAAAKYKGGIPRLELVKSHPDFKGRLYRWFDEIASEREAMLAIAERPPWKRIKLGTHKSAEALRQTLIDGGFKIGFLGDEILERITVVPESTTVELVLVTVAELGFPEGATRQGIYEKASYLGLQPCPAEVGPQLRLQYPDQPRDEWLLMAMEPITDSVGRLNVFRVEHAYDGQRLNAYYGSPGYFWYGHSRWVFCRK